MVDDVIHVLDPMNGCIRTIKDGIVGSMTPCCTLDISTGPWGWGPQDMHITDDTIYLMDSYNNQLKSSPRNATGGFVEWTVIAGNGSRPYHGQSVDGPALENALNEPHGMAVTSDGSGDIYISETWSSCVKLFRNGTLTTVAGTCGFGGHADVAEGGDMSKARFQHNHKVTLDPRNESRLYLSDAECWDDDGPPDDQAYYPCATTDDGVCFSGVRLLELDRVTGLVVSVSTVSGKATSKKDDKTSKKCNGYADGNLSVAEFNFIHGTEFLPLSDEEKRRKRAGEELAGSDALYVCDEDGNRIRKIDFVNGEVTTLAGDGKAGHKDGPAATADFDYPGGIGLDTSGNIYVGDYEDNRVRLISNAAVVV